MELESTERHSLTPEDIADAKDTRGGCLAQKRRSPDQETFDDRLLRMHLAVSADVPEHPHFFVRNFDLFGDKTFDIKYLPKSWPGAIISVAVYTLILTLLVLDFVKLGNASACLFSSSSECEYDQIFASREIAYNERADTGLSSSANLDIPPIMVNITSSITFYERDHLAAVQRISVTDNTGYSGKGLASQRAKVRTVSAGLTMAHVPLNSFNNDTSTIFPNPPLWNSDAFRTSLQDVVDKENGLSYASSAEQMYDYHGLLEDGGPNNTWYPHTTHAFFRFRKAQLNKIKRCQLQLRLMNHGQLSALKTLGVLDDEAHQGTGVFSTLTTDSATWRSSHWSTTSDSTTNEITSVAWAPQKDASLRERIASAVDAANAATGGTAAGSCGPYGSGLVGEISGKKIYCEFDGDGCYMLALNSTTLKADYSATANAGFNLLHLEKTYTQEMYDAFEANFSARAGNPRNLSETAKVRVDLDWYVESAYVNNFVHTAQNATCDGSEAFLRTKAYVVEPNKSTTVLKMDKVYASMTNQTTFYAQDAYPYPQIPFFLLLTGTGGSERVTVTAIDRTSDASYVLLYVTRESPQDHSAAAAAQDGKSDEEKLLPPGPPDTWTCAAHLYNARQGCDCMCGAPDPDCLLPTQALIGCSPAETCSDVGRCTPATVAGYATLSDPCRTLELSGETRRVGFVGDEAAWLAQEGGSCAQCYDVYYGGRAGQQLDGTWVCSHKPEGYVMADTTYTHEASNTCLTWNQTDVSHLAQPRHHVLNVGRRTGFPVNYSATYKVTMNPRTEIEEVLTTTDAAEADTESHLQIAQIQGLMDDTFMNRHVALATLIGGVDQDTTSILVKISPTFEEWWSWLYNACGDSGNSTCDEEIVYNENGAAVGEACEDEADCQSNDCMFESDSMDPKSSSRANGTCMSSLERNSSTESCFTTLSDTVKTLARAGDRLALYREYAPRFGFSETGPFDILVGHKKLSVRRATNATDEGYSLLTLDQTPTFMAGVRSKIITTLDGDQHNMLLRVTADSFSSVYDAQSKECQTTGECKMKGDEPVPALLRGSDPEDVVHVQEIFITAVVPSDWTCDPKYYGDGHLCDCGCGTFDPDCAIGDGSPFTFNQRVFQQESAATCHSDYDPIAKRQAGRYDAQGSSVDWLAEEETEYFGCLSLDATVTSLMTLFPLKVGSPPETLAQARLRFQTTGLCGFDATVNSETSTVTTGNATIGQDFSAATFPNPCTENAPSPGPGGGGGGGGGPGGPSRRLAGGPPAPGPGPSPSSPGPSPSSGDTTTTTAAPDAGNDTTTTGPPSKAPTKAPTSPPCHKIPAGKPSASYPRHGACISVCHAYTDAIRTLSSDTNVQAVLMANTPYETLKLNKTLDAAPTVGAIVETSFPSGTAYFEYDASMVKAGSSLKTKPDFDTMKAGQNANVAAGRRLMHAEHHRRLQEDDSYDGKDFSAQHAGCPADGRQCLSLDFEAAPGVDDGSPDADAQPTGKATMPMPRHAPLFEGIAKTQSHASTSTAGTATQWTERFSDPAPDAAATSPPSKASAPPSRYLYGPPPPPGESFVVSSGKDDGGGFGNFDSMSATQKEHFKGMLNAGGGSRVAANAAARAKMGEEMSKMAAMGGESFGMRPPPMNFDRFAAMDASKIRDAPPTAAVNSTFVASLAKVELVHGAGITPFAPFERSQGKAPEYTVNPDTLDIDVGIWRIPVRKPLCTDAEKASTGSDDTPCLTLCPSEPDHDSPAPVNAHADEDGQDWKHWTLQDHGYVHVKNCRQVRPPVTDCKCVAELQAEKDRYMQPGASCAMFMPPVNTFSFATVQPINLRFNFPAQTDGKIHAQKVKHKPEYVVDFTIGYEFIFKKSSEKADKGFSMMSDVELDLDQRGKVEGAWRGAMLYRSTSNARQDVHDRVVPASHPDVKLNAQIQLQDSAVEIIRAHRAAGKLTDSDAWPAGWSAATLAEQTAKFEPVVLTWDFSGLHDGGSTDLQTFTLKPGVRTTFSAKVTIYPTYVVSALTESIVSVKHWTVKATSSSIAKRELPLPLGNVGQVRYIFEFDSAAHPLMLTPSHSLTKTLKNVGAIFAYTAIALSVLTAVQNFLHKRTMKWYAKENDLLYQKKKLIRLSKAEKAELERKRSMSPKTKKIKTNAVAPAAAEGPRSSVSAPSPVPATSLQTGTAADASAEGSAAAAAPAVVAVSEETTERKEAKKGGKAVDESG